MMKNTDIRLQQLHTWLRQDLQWQDYQLEIASADASFRCYFRLHRDNKSYIVMDAPPEKEDTRPFIDITQRLLQADIHAPAIIADNVTQGFLVLEDLGNTPYLDRLNEQTADDLYQDAMMTLLQMQQTVTQDLPIYDTTLLQNEMQLMPDWFLKIHLGITLNETQNTLIQATFDALSTAALQQPQGFVHRDYHSRNLMITARNNPGVIDYQDAVYGAITYDLVSLLRDCYIVWSVEKIEQWVLNFKQLAVQKSIIPDCDDATFLRWFDLMGLQRHIKVLGIFTRLFHRDGKAGYLNDLPLTLTYVMTVGKKHPETHALIQLFEQLNIPQKIGLNATL